MLQARAGDTNEIRETNREVLRNITKSDALFRARALLAASAHASATLPSPTSSGDATSARAIISNVRVSCFVLVHV